MKLILTLLFTTFFLTGCFKAVGPDYEKPEPVNLDQAWNHQLGEGLVRGEKDFSQWWSVLNDPYLSHLMQQAQSNSPDLRAAFSRIDQARAIYGIAKSDFYPTVDVIASDTRLKTSEALTDQDSSTDNYEEVGTQAAWEIDLFGRIRRQTEAARAEVGSSIEDYRDVLVSLHAEIARTYIEMRTLQKRLEITERNIKLQKETLDLVEARYAAELISQVDVFQAQQNLASSQSVLPVIRSALGRTINHLAILVGKTPGALEKEITAKRDIPDVPQEVVVAIPHEVMRQRPDVRRAERNLAAETARIGIATADLYPRLSLEGFFSFATGMGSGGLFSSDSETWGFGPNLYWNVYQGGQTRSRIALADARTEEARAAYERTVLQAFEDVENSIINFEEERKRIVYLKRSATAAGNVVEKARVLYRSDLINFQTVLDSQRVLLQEEDKLAESEGALVRYLVSIYRSMGGGWSKGSLPSKPGA